MATNSVRTQLLFFGDGILTGGDPSDDMRIFATVAVTLIALRSSRPQRRLLLLFNRPNLPQVNSAVFKVSLIDPAVHGTMKVVPPFQSRESGFSVVDCVLIAVAIIVASVMIVSGISHSL
jgi:hypothetical protein